MTRFKCLVGHVFSASSMRDGYADAVEGALWTAVRTLEQTASFERKLADDAAARGHDLSAGRFNDIATSREQHAKTIRDLLMKKSETSKEVLEKE